MGQYWVIMNLDKKECLNCYRLGSGAKAWEQIANDLPGRALLVLTLAQREVRGGGDLEMDESNQPLPAPYTTYAELAHDTIGRWAGDRIAIVGDYAKDSDLAPEHNASKILAEARAAINNEPSQWQDVTEIVATVLSHELAGIGEFKYKEEISVYADGTIERNEIWHWHRKK